MLMLINDIKKLINPEVQIEILNKNGHGMIILEEKGKEAKLKRVTIRGFEANQTFAFKLDVEGKRITNYLNPSAKYINKGSDAIIFTCFNNECYIFICELKSGKPTEKEYLLQFKNSYLFIKYIHSLLESFYHFKLLNKFSIKYLLFDKQQKNKLNKTKIKIDKIIPNKIISAENEIFYIYKIHHLAENEFLNIRHLKLT